MTLKRFLMLVLAFPLCAASHASEVRFATFNCSMNFSEIGAINSALGDPSFERGKKLAAILQHIRADVILLNEFDFDRSGKSVELLKQNFLSQPQYGLAAIEYPYSYQAPVNTGVDSGLDLNANGKKGEAADAFGFGLFPGQFGMLVLSKYPIDAQKIRSFQKFLWKDMPNASMPVDPETMEPYYPEKTWQQLRLSSKSIWDLPVSTPVGTIHFLVSHPTPPVFDGPEDRNGHRNKDEIRFLADYIDSEGSAYIYDDEGRFGGLKAAALFVIAGDLNSDPLDGDSQANAVAPLLLNGRTLTAFPTSEGAVEQAGKQGGENLRHKGHPAMDTGDFNDKQPGNLHLDYLLPSRGFKILDSGVFWPLSSAKQFEWIDVSDHRAVWMSLALVDGGKQ